MPKAKAGKLLGEFSYFIVEGPAGKEKKVQVDADEIAYNVFGIRKDGKRWILDHIPSGYRVKDFKTAAQAREAIRQLIQVSHFRWVKPPKAIRPQCVAILKQFV